MDIEESYWLPAIYDCSYLSDESESECTTGSNCFSINSDTTIIETDLNLHQILNYPPLEKHTANKIIQISLAIDLIWSKLILQ
jgi:hypothetical protein